MASYGGGADLAAIPHVWRYVDNLIAIHLERFHGREGVHIQRQLCVGLCVREGGREGGRYTDRDIETET